MNVPWLVFVGNHSESVLVAAQYSRNSRPVSLRAQITGFLPYAPRYHFEQGISRFFAFVPQSAL
jgi:hypothetical protein